MIAVTDYEIATTAERAFLDALDGSCRTPIAALALVEGRRLTFLGEALTPDGGKRWRREAVIDLGGEPETASAALGRRLGLEIRADAGGALDSEILAAAAW